MKRFAKIFSILAGIILIVAVAGAIALYTLVDTDTLKKQVADAVHKQTGRDIVFTGDIGLSVFPWLGVDIGEVTLSNAPGFGDTPFAKLQRASVKVKLVPLLSQKIEVSSIIIDGLDLNLARNKKGVSNWDDLAKGKPQPKTTEPQVENLPDSGKQAEGMTLASLDIGGVSITRANVSWDDAAQGQKVNVKDFNLSTGPLGLGKPFDFDLSGALTAATPKVAAQVSAKARADLGKDFKTPSLTGLNLSIKADGDVIPGGKVDAKILGDILVDLNTSTITLNSVNLKAMDMDVNAKVKVDKFDTSPVVNAKLDVAQFNPRTLMKALGITPPATTDPAVLSKAKVKLAAVATMDSATVDSLDLTLDDTTLTGSASVQNFKRPAIKFNLKANTLDVDRYLPPEAKKEMPQDEKSTPAPTPGSKDKGATKSGLPKEELRKLNVDGTLQVKSLKVKNVTATDMNIKLKAKNGLIRITPFSAGLYGGILRTKMTADFRKDTTKTFVDLGLKDLGLGPMLAAVLGQDKVTGIAEAALKLSATGDDLKSVLETLTGNAAVALRNGVFKGFQVIPEAVKKQASAQSAKMKNAKQQKEQPFDAITASFDIKNGLVSTGDTRLSARGMSGVGAGSVNLAKQTINYSTTVNITALPKVPFTITGTFDNPKVALNTKKFIEDAATGILKAPLDIGKGALGVGEDAIKGIGKGLLDIFGRSKKNDNQ